MNMSRDLFTRYGKRAYILSTRFAEGYHNLALEEAVEILRAQRIACEVDVESEENPSVEFVARATERIRNYQPDFIVAIGGGSVLDAAKAVNILIQFPPDADPYTVFYTGLVRPVGSKSEGALPMISVPTTAGSGAEVAGYAILTRKDLHTKQRINQLSFFTDAFLDARYVESAPQWLLDAGMLDALAHGLEGYMNVDASIVSRCVTDSFFGLFARFKNALLDAEITQEDFDNMLLAGTIQGMASIQSSTTLPHGMGYVLTHQKGLLHGFAACVFEAEYLKHFHTAEHQKQVRHMVSACGFPSLDELRDYVWRVISRNASFSVSADEIKQWAASFFENKGRLARHPEPIEFSEIQDIYRESLRFFM